MAKKDTHIRSMITNSLVEAIDDADELDVPIDYNDGPTLVAVDELSTAAKVALTTVIDAPAQLLAHIVYCRHRGVSNHRLLKHSGQPNGPRTVVDEISRLIGLKLWDFRACVGAEGVVKRGP